MNTEAATQLTASVLLKSEVLSADEDHLEIFCAEMMGKATAPSHPGHPPSLFHIYQGHGSFLQVKSWQRPLRNLSKRPAPTYSWKFNVFVKITRARARPFHFNPFLKQRKITLKYHWWDVGKPTCTQESH